MSDLTDIIHRVDLLIGERRPVGEIKHHLIDLRDRAVAMEQELVTLRESKKQAEIARAKDQHRITELEQQQAKPPAAVPSTERDLCPHCGQPKGNLDGVKQGRPPRFGSLETYTCSNCGGSYEKQRS